MRKSISIKTLLRSPLKTILTFTLIAAASFALFSRVIGYAVTEREMGRAESYYCGVAALDNSVPDITTSVQIEEGVTIGSIYGTEDKPWPTDKQIEEFSSLPGVTVADTRYMTAGLVEDYMRLVDDSSGYGMNRFIIEGTYIGYDKDEVFDGMLDLKFDEVRPLAGDLEFDQQEPTVIKAWAAEEQELVETPFQASYFKQLEGGSRCLILGTYNALTGGELQLDNATGREAFRVLDDATDEYLETEAFAFYKGVIDAVNQAVYTYDIVYTSDMRTIPRFNERNIVMDEGRPLVSGDTEGCVVSSLFMETHNLSLGDKISVQLGDKLFRQDGIDGAKARDGERMSKFVDNVDLEIIGAYRFTDIPSMRMAEEQWSYSSSTIFVPSSLLPVEVPDDYESTKGEFSVFIENARDIEAFYEAAEPLAREMDLALRFSDRGWLSMKDSFEAGSRTSFLTTVLYISGTALALLLAVYLYISRDKKTYAIMRTQGVSTGKARSAVVLPLGVLAVPAIIGGGMTGIFHASATTAETLDNIVASTAGTIQDYTLDASIPMGLVLLTLFCELLFITLIIVVLLRKIGRMPLLELLQDNVVRAGADTKVGSDFARSESIPVSQENTKTSVSGELPLRGKYGALRQVTAYILRHMRRGTGKTAISLILTVVMTAGVGLFALARLTYQDAFRETNVNGRALEFSSASIIKLAKSSLITDFYCYGNIQMLINDQEHNQTITVTNDLKRCLPNDFTVSYASGYDDSLFTSSGQVCLLGEIAAETYGVRPGDEISVVPYDLYRSLSHAINSEEKLKAAVEQATTKYKVAGLIESEDESIRNGIFAAANSETEDAYGQAFPFEYSEFTLADNERLDDLNRLLDTQKRAEEDNAPMASFYIDSGGLENVGRVRDLLNLLFPVALIAAVLIGAFGQGLMIIQLSREAAFMRILGVTKKRVRCILVFEQVVLCFAGLFIVTEGLLLYNLELMIRSTSTLVVCGLLYLTGSLCGATGASVLVTRRKALELLQVKE